MKRSGRGGALVSLGLAALSCRASPPAAAAPTNAVASAPAIGPSVTPPLPAPPRIDKELLRAYADSRGFTRGAPRSATVTPDSRAVLFLRSGPKDGKQSLYEMDVASGSVRTLVTPESLASGAEQLTAEERARRERMRVTASGFTAFELSFDGKTIVVALSGNLYAVDRTRNDGSVTTHVIATGKGAVIDPHLSPDGKLVAYVQNDDVHVASVDGSAKPRAITTGGTERKPHGLTDFAAAEELSRSRGFWWSPDSTSILFEEADAAALPQFTIADPAHPERPADRVGYPRAGTSNAVLRFGIVRVAMSSPSPGSVRWIDWERTSLPYIATVTWNDGAPPSLVALDRAQQNEVLLVVDPRTGKTREAVREHDDAWVNYNSDGHLRWLPDGSAFLWRSERDGDARVALVSSRDASKMTWLTPPGTQVVSILDIDAPKRTAILETTRDALHFEVTRVSLERGEPVAIAKLEDGAVHGSFNGSHDVFLAREGSLSGAHRLVVRTLDGRTSREVPSVAALPPVPASPVEMESVGPDGVHVALVRPRSYVAGSRAAYPLIDSAYGGPHVQVVDLDPRSIVFKQWMADATGAIVVSIDSKGTPNRGRAWERALRGRLSDVPLEGHVDVIRALVASHPEIDASRIGVYGASFGGTFAALAVLRHPEVYSAAVSIAPVTDWRNYDTAYTERYMGLPDANVAAYDAASVVRAAAVAPALGPGSRSPTLLLAHGTADDNVYFFNSLELVDALEKSGRDFTFLPFAGQTHQFASPDAMATLWLKAAETLAHALAPTRH